MTATSAPEPRRLLGQVLSGRYRIDDLIGEGGMGAVYRAEHLHMRKRLAVKVLHPEMSDIAEAAARFEREAIAGAHVEHPNVASALDFGRLDDGSYFLVLEYLEGEDLRTALGRGPLPPDRALRIARQIALGLRAAHALGIVHRDLKPENVMLIRKDGEADVVKILDFGIAKVPVDAIAARGAGASALTQLGMVYGTPQYMPPEQALGVEIDGRADLYALGVVLYEMLAGERPFDSTDRSALVAMVVAQPPPPLAERVPGGVVPPALDALVMRLLEKRADDRFPTAGDVVDAIDDLGLPIAAPRAFGSSPDRTSSPGRSSSPDRPPAPDRTIAPARASSSGLARDATIAARKAPTALHVRPGAPDPGARDRRSGSLPSPLGVPVPALLASAGAAAIAILVCVAVLVRSQAAVDALEEPEAAASAPAPTSSTTGRAAARPPPSAAPSSPRADLAPASELAAARLAGLPALGPLAQRYPTDPAVLKALMSAHAGDKAGHGPAVRVAKRLLEVDPASAGDEDVRRTLAAIANGPAETASAAFELMATRMGSHGPDLVFEIFGAASSSKYAKDRAAALLQDPEIKKLASPSMLVAYDLRASLPCGRKALFARAKEHGDDRALPYLKPLLSTANCGGGIGSLFRRGECYATCLGPGGVAELKETIATIEARAPRR